MNNKPFEQWWAGLRDVGEMKLVKAIDLEIEARCFHVNEAEARELHAQIIEAADYAMPCTIMRRFAQMDDSPLGCYVPVAYCDHYGAFEELIQAAGKPHALICIQRQEEKRKPKAEPKPEPEPIEATEEADDEDQPYIVEMRFLPFESWIERGRFDTAEDAKLFTHEDGAFAPPGQREYRVRRCDEKPEPEAEAANVARAMVLAQDVEELTKERDQLRTELARLKKIAADYVFNGLQSGYVNEFRDAIDEYLPK